MNVFENTPPILQGDGTYVKIRNCLCLVHA
jgi:hypothetical protein